MTPPRLFSPAFLALTMADLAYFTAGGLVIFATPFFVTGPLQSTEASVGLVMGSFSLSTLLVRPLVGRLVDRYGRRRLLIAGATTFAVVVAAHSLASGLVALVVLRLMLGAAEALFFVAGFAALADLAPAGRQGEALSFNSLALYLGVALGPWLGEWLMRRGGFALTWGGGFALAALAAGLALRVPETGEVGTGERTPLLHGAATGPGLALFVGVAGMATFFTYAALHADAIGMRQASTVLLLFGLVVVGCRVALAKLPDRLPPMSLIVASLVLSGAGLAAAAFSDSAAPLVFGAVLLAVGVAFLTPAVFVAIFRVVPPSERGAAAATTSIFIDLGLGGGPVLAGLAVARFSIPGAFSTAAALALLAAVAVLWAGFRKPRAAMSSPSA